MDIYKVYFVHTNLVENPLCHTWALEMDMKSKEVITDQEGRHAVLKCYLEKS